MRIFLRCEDGTDFKPEKHSGDVTLGQFYHQYVPGIFHFELINLHFMVCVDLDVGRVTEICFDPDKVTLKKIIKFVRNYEKNCMFRLD